jgi:hypothetical protein
MAEHGILRPARVAVLPAISDLTARVSRKARMITTTTVIQVTAIR